MSFYIAADWMLQIESDQMFQYSMENDFMIPLDIRDITPNDNNTYCWYMKFYFNRIKTKEFFLVCIGLCLNKAYCAIIWILFCLPFGYGIQFLVDIWIDEFDLRTRARSFAFLD